MVMPVKLRDEINAMAEKQEISVALFIRQALRAALDILQSELDEN